MKVEEFFSEGFRLAKPKYWTIFFNFLIYGVLIVIAAITIIGLLIVPSLAVGLVRFTIRAGRGEEVDNPVVRSVKMTRGWSAGRRRY